MPILYISHILLLYITGSILYHISLREEGDIPFPTPVKSLRT